MTKTGKGLGTKGTVAVVIGLTLLGFGAYYILVIGKNRKKKKDCLAQGGTWDEKTKSCILPEKIDKVDKVLKDAYSNLTFEVAKSIIKPSSYPFLDEIVSVMADSDASQWKLEIKGHTDNVGENEYNQKLSEMRAKAVKDYLISKGLLATRITAQGFGETMPIASNDTKDGREKNRRVEFIVIKPTGEVVTTQEKPEDKKPEESKTEDKKPSETVVKTKEKIVQLIG
jgi:outer membrane protein OmpA-like peptidoglycan-associated protein